MSPLGPRRFRSVPPDGGVPSWEAIARDHARFIYTVAFRLTGRHDDAQDLVQEVMIRVQKGLVTYQPGSLTGWLARITTNVFLDAERRRKRRPTVALDEIAVLPASSSADDELAAAQLPDYLQQALAALPADFRAPIVLCDVVGLRYDEIAEVLDVPIGTVRSRIHRGRMQLAARLR